MPLPPRMLRIIQAMCDELHTVSVVGWHRCIEVPLRSGIRQGWPLSETLVAIALDQAIRYCLAQATFASCRIFVAADDLAVVRTCIAIQLGALGDICVQKCVTLPLMRGSCCRLRALDAVVAFSGMAISSAARYLGVMAFPESHAVQRDAVCPKITARSMDVAGTGAALFTKIRLWNLHGCGLLACKKRFVELDGNILKVFRRATQQVTQAQWMAFPRALLVNGDLAGGVALRDPARMGRASRWALIRGRPYALRGRTST